MFRKKQGRLEVLLAGGPYFQNKDGGIWTVPKGEVGEGEDLLARAKIEFEEELGVAPRAAELIELGWIKQKGGKIVHAWAFEGRFKGGLQIGIQYLPKWNGRPVLVRWNPFRKLTGLRFFQ
jgi:predicted NUDIX family NTP pyrophosphohydrolase